MPIAKHVRPSRPHFDERVNCYVQDLQYDFHLRAGTLYVSSGTTPHRDGIIQLFTGMDDRVVAIAVLRRLGERVALYRKDKRTGAWSTASEDKP